MSQRELSRLEVIQRVCRKTLTQRRAADLLALSVRQIKRLCRAYRREGAAALASKRRGRPSNHRLPEEVITRARGLLRERYHDFGPTLAREKLAEAHGLLLGVETVRQWMAAEGLWRPRRALQAVIHQLRERRACVGELVQLDGSPQTGSRGAPRAARY
jgi:transposase